MSESSRTTTPFSLSLKRRPFVRIVSGACALSSIVLALLPAVAVILVHYATPDMALLQAEENQIIATVEAYRTRRGRFPATLAKAGVVVAPTRFGEWQWDGGAEVAREIHLRFGDYRQPLHPFVLWWDAAAGRWQLDE